MDTNVTAAAIRAAPVANGTPEKDDRRKAGRLIWVYVLGIAGVHALACLAFVPWLFNWSNVLVMVAGVLLFGQGVNLGYHRLLTHRGLKVPRWFEYALVVAALCSLQDTPVRWVTAHRYHHRYSDQRNDVHSPFAGFFWAHMGWLFRENRDIRSISAYSRYAKDLLGDPFYRALERSRWLSAAVFLAHGALFLLVGFAIGWMVTGVPGEGLRHGLGLLVWGVFVRTVIVWHITWSVNSFCHVFGYRTHETKDNSRNNWIVGLLAAGEGWHNNHHSDQASARHGRRWWELDLTWVSIWLLESLGLATAVVRPRLQRRRA